MMCMWLSIKPGTTRRPFRSIALPPLPASAITSRSEPTAVKRPSMIATASAWGLLRSSVVMRPLRRIRSGCMLWALVSPNVPVPPTKPVAANPCRSRLLVFSTISLRCLVHRNRFPLAQASGIESRIALWGNPIPGHGQATDNIALRPRDDALAKTARVSVAHPNNIERQCRAFFGQFVLVLLKALENIIRLHRNTAALFFDRVTTGDRSSGSFRSVLRVGNAVLGAKDQDVKREERRTNDRTCDFLHNFLPSFSSWIVLSEPRECLFVH